MNSIVSNLPQSLAEMVAECEWIPVDAPYSGASTYLIRGEEGPHRYLKVSSLPHPEPLSYAKERLEWLRGRLPVPKVLYYYSDAERELLLTEEIPGHDCSDQTVWGHDVEEMISQFAMGLKRLHAVDISDCPFDHSLDTRIRIAKSNVQRDALDQERIARQFPGRTFREHCNFLLTKRPSLVEDKVFTHGDYSMPNVIIHRGQISGFIDLGNSGIADRYQDLAIAAKSIQRNYGDKWITPFFRAYGEEIIDIEKVHYYQLLEQFVFP